MLSSYLADKYLSSLFFHVFGRWKSDFLGTLPPFFPVRIINLAGKLEAGHRIMAPAPIAIGDCCSRDKSPKSGIGHCDESRRD
ncbi:hypothetical protein [Stappia sp. 28M-7]|uniref:hypothetical protein n=1 Tax=Stappia sp. 28M-7 TaxID=2762596 RepID=UPI00163B7BA0|nr:hypothetical protein [Stappia sp. 28M-7]MBC2860787.1 hypothetical protein [Stappia sp. 28M-7]